MTDDPTRRLASQLRAWADRPTRLSPQAARSRVLAELSEPGRWPAWRLITGAATVAAGVLALALLLWPQRQPDALPTPTPAVAAQRTIVHQLSSGTSLYIVIRPEAAADDC